MLHGKLQGLPIATLQQFRLAALAAMPYRAYRMDNIIARQLIRLGDFRIPRFATAKRSTLRQEFLPRRTMNCAVHAASTKQILIGGINDCVRIVPCRDVTKLCSDI